jgi:uncharacterized protein (DUF2062 family)
VKRTWFYSAYRPRQVQRCATISVTSPARCRAPLLCGSVARRNFIWTRLLRDLAGWCLRISPRWNTNWQLGEQGSSRSPQPSIMKRGFFHRRFVAPIVALLTQGITPEKIALSLAFGIVLGIFPVLGSTTVLCAAAAVIFGLNLPAIQLVNWLIYPMQLFLLVPFIRLGEKLFRTAPLQFSLAQILTMVRADLPHAVSTLWLAEVHAIVAWLLTGPPRFFRFTSCCPEYFARSRPLTDCASVGGPSSERWQQSRSFNGSSSLLTPHSANSIWMNCYN